MEGDGDGMPSNAGDAAENDQTRTLTLDQDQEGDRKEEEVEVEADSGAGCTIDRLRDEIQDLQCKNRELQLRLDASKSNSRFLADTVDYLEDELVRAQQGLALQANRLKLAVEDLEAHKGSFDDAKAGQVAQARVLVRQLRAAAEAVEKEIRGFQEMTKEMEWKVRGLIKKLRVTRIKALEEAKTRLEGALVQFRSGSGERDAALAATKNALMVSWVVAAVASVGALAASAAAFYFRKVRGGGTCCLGCGVLFSESP